MLENTVELPSKRAFSMYIFTKSVHREGNGNPPQYSCLENPMDGEAW